MAVCPGHRLVKLVRPINTLLSSVLQLNIDAGSPKGWKPLSISTPILSALVILTLLIAATVEILAQRSASHGGLALSPSLDAIPRYAMWSYLYGPNVVAVLYSLVWSWVDLDVKRMQPWFELSKEGGATAEGSLFLDYPYDFVAVAPWRAAKKRYEVAAVLNMLYRC